MQTIQDVIALFNSIMATYGVETTIIFALLLLLFGIVLIVWRYANQPSIASGLSLLQPREEMMVTKQTVEFLTKQISTLQQQNNELHALVKAQGEVSSATASELTLLQERIKQLEVHIEEAEARAEKAEAVAAIWQRRNDDLVLENHLLKQENERLRQDNKDLTKERDNAIKQMREIRNSVYNDESDFDTQRFDIGILDE